MIIRRALSLLLVTAMLAGGVLVPALAEEEVVAASAKEESGAFQEVTPSESREDEAPSEPSDVGSGSPSQTVEAESEPEEVIVELPSGDDEAPGDEPGEEPAEEPGDESGETGETGGGDPAEAPGDDGEETEDETQSQSAHIRVSPVAESVSVGEQAGFRFKITHAVSVVFTLTAPDGDVVASGEGGNGEGTFTFTPTMGGRYYMSIAAVSEDGSEVNAGASLTAVEVATWSLKVKADAECCHGGDAVSFTLELSEGVEIAKCAISAWQGGSEFYSSDSFSDKITVAVPVRGDVTKVTLSAAVTDVNGREVEDSVTIPCAVYDEETRAQWEATMSGVTLTGVWPDDLVAIARSQVGYQESSIDFGPKMEGGISGYTRYGHWAGMRYEEWCGMFASFCLHYAGISEQEIPYAANCQRWIRSLEAVDLFARRGSYEPQVGDLVMFDWEGDNDSDHVGIIEKVNLDGSGHVTGLYTIEGNSEGGRVTSGEYYDADNWQIVGYGLVNTAYERKLAKQAQRLVGEGDGITVTAVAGAEAALPENARVVVRGAEGDASRLRRLAKALGSDSALSFVRFVEIGFTDEDGRTVEPQAAVSLTVEFGQSAGSGSLRPGVALMKDKRAEVDRAVVLTRRSGGSSFAFEQRDFDGVIAVFATGVMKCRRGSLSATDGDARAALNYAASAGVPDGAGLTLRTIDAGSGRYDDLTAQLAAAAQIPEGAAVRFFELGLELNGIGYNIDDVAAVEIDCGQSAGGARVVCLEEGRATGVSSNGSVVRFNTNTLGVFAVIYTAE